LAFSPKGNYLVCALSRWNSLIFLDLHTGQFRDWLSTGFGLVDFSLMSSKEDRIMSYLASTGVLVYHDLASGEEMKRINTKPRLQGLQVVPDGSKTKAIALDNGQATVIDLVAGGVLDSKSAGFPITQILTDDTKPQRLLALGGSPGALRIAELSLDENGRLKVGALDKSSLKFQAGSACLSGGQLLLAEQGGRLWRWAPGDQRNALTEARTIAINSVALTEGVLYLGSAVGTIRLNLGLVSEPGSASVTRLDQVSVPGIPAGSILNGLNERELLFWDGSRSPRLNRWDIRKDNLIKNVQTGNGSILNLAASGDQVSVVDSSGMVRVFGLSELRQTNAIPAAGAFCSALTNDGRLLIGQGAASANATPLRRVALKSGETIPVPSLGQTILQMAIQGSTNLFALASASENGKPVNLLLIGNADGLNRQLLAIPGEDLGADLQIAADTGKLYTSLGGSVISVWDGSAFGTLEPAPHASRKLAIQHDYLASINSDGSLSLYDLSLQKLLLDIHISSGGVVYCLTRNHGVAIAGRQQGNKTLAADPKEQAAILGGLGQSMDSPEPVTALSLPFALE
jgi:WD40 repeat protein